MSMCEQCWGDAFMRSLSGGKSQSEHYMDLLKEHPEGHKRTHLCPVCAMPAPSGLVHCSLACEERDPVPQPEEEGEPWDREEDHAPLEGASDGS